MLFTINQSFFDNDLFFQFMAKHSKQTVISQRVKNKYTCHDFYRNAQIYVDNE